MQQAGVWNMDAAYEKCSIVQFMLSIQSLRDCECEVHIVNYAAGSILMQSILLTSNNGFASIIKCI